MEAHLIDFTKALPLVFFSLHRNTNGFSFLHVVILAVSLLDTASQSDGNANRMIHRFILRIRFKIS